MTRAALAGVAGLAVAWALTVSPPGLADEPITGSDPVTVTTTRTVTVPARVHGRSAASWAREARQRHRDADARGRTVKRLRRAARARAGSGLTGLVGAFLCIHRYEGGWGSNTGNGYHGGLQMDGAFQSAYGSWAISRWGPAENWPADVQIVVAITAYYSGRGYGPWPNTARACGLL